MSTLPRSTEPVIDESYFAASLEKPLHELYRVLEPHLNSPGVAVDLGCGVGHAALFLAEKGYEVWAVDASSLAIEALRSRVPESAMVHLVQADMKEWPLPECDVVSAGFSLFFLDSSQFDSFWPRLVNALRPGGLFVGQFLGVNDEWREGPHKLMNRSSALSALGSFNLLHFEEVEQEGETVRREPKHWHVFHVVARKRE